MASALPPPLTLVLTDGSKTAFIAPLTTVINFFKHNINHITTMADSIAPASTANPLPVPATQLHDDIVTSNTNNSQDVDGMDTEQQLASTPHSLDGILISYTGKDAIKDAWERRVLPTESLENAKDFFDFFRSKHQLQFESIEDVLIFLEASGITRNQFAKMIMSNLVNLTKQRIRNMTQEQLSNLLEKCFTYLTVKELAPIAIATLEHLKYVPPHIWTQIVSNGVKDPPYIGLPLGLKHRIWAHEPQAFEFEINLILDRVTDANNLNFLYLENNLTPELRKESNLILKDFLSLVQGLTNELIANAAEKIYEKTCNESNQLRRIALADLFHDFLILAPTRSYHPPLSEIRRYAKALSLKNTSATNTNNATNINIAEKDIESIYLNIMQLDSESRPYSTFMLSSSISRDFLSDQIIIQLFHCRGDIGNGENEQLLKQAQQHLQNQQLLVHFTYLLLYNIKGMRLLLDRDTVLPDEVNRLFQVFYPLLIGEMHNDVSAKQSDHTKLLPSYTNPKLLPLVYQGKFERRIIASYCLCLWRNQDTSGLFRQRLLMDAIITTCDPKEEAREHVIVTTLFNRLNEL